MATWPAVSNWLFSDVSGYATWPGIPLAGSHLAITAEAEYTLSRVNMILSNDVTEQEHREEWEPRELDYQNLYKHLLHPGITVLLQ